MIYRLDMIYRQHGPSAFSLLFILSHILYRILVKHLNWVTPINFTIEKKRRPTSALYRLKIHKEKGD